MFLDSDVCWHDFFQSFVSSAKQQVYVSWYWKNSSLYLLFFRVATVQINGCRASIADTPTFATLGAGSQRNTWMRVEMPYTRRSKLRPAPHSWTKRMLVFSGCWTNGTEERNCGTFVVSWWNLTREASDQQLPTGMMNAGKQHGRSEQRSTGTRKKGLECAVVVGPDHVVNGKSIGSHNQGNKRRRHGCVATSFSSPKTMQDFFFEAARGVGVYVRYAGCGEKSGEKIKVFERYVNIGISALSKIGFVIPQTEEGVV